MPIRTSSQSVRDQMKRNLTHGRTSFKVLAVDTGHDGEKTNYIVGVPRATMRTRLGRLAAGRRALDRYQPTAFGDELISKLNSIKGVEATIDNDTPNIVEIALDRSLENRQPPERLREAVRDMPAVVCEAIEEAILRNEGVGQRTAEQIRRML